MPKVLVIEDATALLKAWVQKFQDQGFEVLIANNKLSALETAARNRPDLVVIDLPERESEETIKKLREFKWGYQVPVLFLNSWEDPEIFIQYSEGLDDHLAYNWSLQEVVERAKSKLAIA